MEKSIITKIITTSYDKPCATQLYFLGILIYIKKHFDAAEYHDYYKKKT